MITLAGKQLIRESLKPTEDASLTVDSVIAVQERCGMSNFFQRVQPALKFIDTLQASRSNLYFELLEDVKAQLELTCATLNEIELVVMLKDTIKFIVVKELRSIPIFIINKLSKIPPRVLEVLDEKGVLGDMPLRVQQAAWKNNVGLFKKRLDMYFNAVDSTSINQMIVSISVDIGRDEQLLSELCIYCVTNKATNKNISTTLRQVLMKLSSSGNRVSAIGKIFDLAAHLDLYVSNKDCSDEFSNQIVEMLSAIIQMDSVHRVKEKDFITTKRSRESIPKSVQPDESKIRISDLEKALDFLIKLDIGRDFADPVTDLIAPGYSSRIKSPMDLTTIRKKLPRYSDLQSLDADVRLMFRNCKDFNGVGSSFGKLSAKYLKAWCAYRDRLGQAPIATTSAAGTTSMPALKRPCVEEEAIFEEVSLPLPQLKPTLLAAWQLLTSLDTAAIFAMPVTEKVAPKYFTVVSDPMDLSTMRVKIDRGLYKLFSDLDKDVSLMITNCSKYNSESSPVYKIGRELLSKWNQAKPSFLGKLYLRKPNTLAPGQGLEKETPEVVDTPMEIMQPSVEAVSVRSQPATTVLAATPPEVAVPRQTISHHFVSTTHAVEGDLPPSFDSRKLSWALCLLQDVEVQALLSRRLEKLLDTTLSTCLHSEMPTLFHESRSVRQTLQLLQVGWDQATALQPVDVRLLRNFVPRCILAILREQSESSFDPSCVASLVRAAIPASDKLFTIYQDFLVDLFKGLLPSVMRLALRKK